MGGIGGIGGIGGECNQKHSGREETLSQSSKLHSRQKQCFTRRVSLHDAYLRASI